MRVLSLTLLLVIQLLTFDDGRTQEPNTPPSSSSSAGVVQQVTELYDAGRLSEAEYLALKTLESPGQLTRMEQAELYRILAFCAVANDDEENGRRHFLSALRLNPNLTADPISWSPKVRRVMDRAREEWMQILRLEAQQRISLEAQVCRQAALKSLYFPGGGQIDKGEKVKGWVTGILFWGAAATFVYAQIAIPSARREYRRETDPNRVEAKYGDYRALERLGTVSGGLTLAVYSYSVLDALFKPPMDANP